MLYILDFSAFDWLTWRAGCLVDVLGVANHTAAIQDNACLLRTYAIGYCPGTQLLCRPKADTMAVMFLVGEQLFWTHLTDVEFHKVWKDYETG